jgi:hypothetical protein
MTMDKLIEALSIFREYRNVERPTHCEHDVLCVMGIEKDEISNEDLARLDALGFFWDEEYDCWASFRFGSA